MAGRTPGKLDPRQEKFATIYAATLDAKRAAIEAGYSPKSASISALNLLKNPQVAQIVLDAKKKLNRKLAIEHDVIIEGLYRSVTFDARRLFDAQGKPLSMAELDADTAACVASIDISESIDPMTGITSRTAKIKTVDRLAATQLLMKHLGMLTDKVDLTSNGNAIGPQVIVYLPDNGRNPKK